MRRIPIEAGQVFNRLTVIKEARYKSAKGEIRYQCQCSCGERVFATGTSLKKGNTQSCGCFRRDNVSRLKTTHGQGGLNTKTTEYRIWMGMKARCYIRSASGYPRYGGRGITVCDHWRDSFEAFFSDMGRRPSLYHSLDRINNDGPYSPENCRWATRIEQNRNTPRNRLLTFNGETMTISAWTERLGLSRSLIYMRLRRGWSVEKSLHG
jgi:hypothetical protein